MSNTLPILYMRLRRVVQITRGRTVKLKDIAELVTPPEYEDTLDDLIIYTPIRRDGNRVLIDMILITNRIREVIPSMQIQLFGEPHVLLEIGPIRRRSSLPLIALVWVVLFIGAGLTIMNFHADVSMAAVHKRIYEMITGRSVERPLLLQIPYSIGIGVGMILFFNHLFKKKFNEEPSPLEVEMFMYQENVNQYVIMEEYQKKKESVKVK
nr:stage V sporulation protein AA [Paenibacillus albiflavus]